MSFSFKALLAFIIAISTCSMAVAQTSRSLIDDGFLYVPRIDVDGYGALELSFRIVFDQEYLLILESADETSLSVQNSGVFDPDQLTIDVDEVELETGDLYAVQLALMSRSEQIIFSVANAVLLNPDPDQDPVDNPSEEPDQLPSSETIELYSSNCSGCHGIEGAGGSAGPSLLACANCTSESVLSDYIRDTMPLGQASRCDASCASVLAAYIMQIFNGDNRQETLGETVGFLRVLEDSDALRKSAQQLLSRLPTLEERQMVSIAGSGGLRQAINGMMEEEAFYTRLTEIFNDYLLTDKYHSRNGSEAAISLLSSDEFPNRRWFDPGSDDRPEDYDSIKRATNNGVAREPLALINHVVKNDLPFTEILTADYMMVNPFSAQSYGVSGLNFRDRDDSNEFLPAVLDGIPHAGILTSPMFLNRYPTTSTNRNRGRARVVFDLFLDTDILAIEGVRPGNAVDITTPIPTINNPECSKCHSILDPVASVFQNWNYRGQYRQARLERQGWYTDMESRGFNGQSMPLAGNVDSSVRWLAQEIAADPKFPRAITRILVNGLSGKEPLVSPGGASASQAEIDAYVAERTLLNDIQSEFVADNYNLKTLVREIMISPYWRASALTSDAVVGRHEFTGSTYLLSPEQLDRKILSLLGFDWRNSLDSYYKDKDRSYASKLNNTFHQIYGGIDSDSVTTRLTSPNGMMGAMQLRMANELACYAVPHDFWLPDNQRRLFHFVDHQLSPYNDAGILDESNMSRIRDNLQYLHKYLLGEELAISSTELLITENLFMNVLNRGRQIILNSGGEWSAVRLPSDCDRTKDLNGESLVETEEFDERLIEDRQYVIRAWMAVVAYLLADYKFLYN